MGAEGLDNLLQTTYSVAIVRIKPSYNVSLSETKPFVQRIALAMVWFGSPTQVSPPRLGAISLKDLKSTVSRATVNYDMFEIWVVLFFDAEQRLFDEPVVVERWSNNGDFRHFLRSCRHSASSFSCVGSFHLVHSGLGQQENQAQPPPWRQTTGPKGP